MEKKWCWRCQIEVPMLDNEEINLCIKARKEGKVIVEREIKKRSIKGYTWLTDEEIPKSDKTQKYFVEMYRLITGFKETNPNAVWHHLLSYHGVDCPNCKKPLRTPEARYCVSCGFGKENLSKDTLPLIKRFPKSLKK